MKWREGILICVNRPVDNSSKSFLTFNMKYYNMYRDIQQIRFNQGSSFYVSLFPKGCVMMLGNAGFYVSAKCKTGWTRAVMRNL
jgi:hypothetical protein